MICVDENEWFAQIWIAAAIAVDSMEVEVWVMRPYLRHHNDHLFQQEQNLPRSQFFDTSALTCNQNKTMGYCVR